MAIFHSYVAVYQRVYLATQSKDDSTRAQAWLAKPHTASTKHPPVSRHARCAKTGDAGNPYLHAKLHTMKYPSKTCLPRLFKAVKKNESPEVLKHQWRKNIPYSHQTDPPKKCAPSRSFFGAFQRRMVLSSSVVSWRSSSFSVFSFWTWPQADHLRKIINEASCRSMIYG